MASEIAERNRRIVERFLTRVSWRVGSTSLTNSATPASSTMPEAPQAREGIDALKRVIGFSRTAMPDQRWSDRVLVADDEYVVVRAVRESTWSAESFRGFATPQGVTTAVEMVHIWRLVDSKIVEHWAVRDDLALMMQLGVVEVGLGARPRVRRSKPGNPLEALSHLLGTPVADPSMDASWSRHRIPQIRSR